MTNSLPGVFRVQSLATAGAAMAMAKAATVAATTPVKRQYGAKN